MGHHHRAMRFPKVSVIQNRARANAQSRFPRPEGASAARGNPAWVPEATQWEARQ